MEILVNGVIMNMEEIKVSTRPAYSGIACRPDLDTPDTGMLRPALRRGGIAAAAGRPVRLGARVPDGVPDRGPLAQAHPKSGS